jgi:hypothetical protein
MPLSPARGSIAPAVKVVYVGGYSRSGGTLLGRVLGQIPGFVAPGELGYLWSRGLAANRLCGCGARFRDCPFWRRVEREAFGSWDAAGLDGLLGLEREVKRHRFIPLLVAPGASSRYEESLRRYAAALASLYRGIAQVAQARVIVDSTLDPAYAFVLRHVPGIDLRAIHLIRDSRGTAHSWSKAIRRSDALEGGYLRTYRPLDTALRWSSDHLLMHLLHRLASPELRVRYEDLVASPRREVERIMAHIDEPVAPGDLDFIAPDAVHVGTDHTVAGNRMRFQRGPLPLALDDEWRTALDRRDRRVVTLMTWPLLRAYGYIGAPERHVPRLRATA